jgi:predicted Zn finger-like uncharacterized protein
MLITTCTHCLARFRVTPQQLNLRQGQVRCGHCQQVFSGFQALERFPDDDTGTRILAARAAGAAQHPHAPPEPPPPIAAVSVESLPDIVADETIAPQLQDEEPTLESTLAPEPLAAGPLEERAPPEPEEAAPAVEATPEEPAHAPAVFIDDYAPPEAPARPPRAWAFGAALLAVVLALQLVHAFRAQVARNYPITRPWLESACEAIGCVVPWVNDHGLLKLEDSELLEVPGKPGEIALSARIRNLAPAAQEFPHLELTLTDLTGQAAARRVLRPTDYLGRSPAPGEVMGAGTELAIQLRLETPRLRATGYELLLFYP